MIRDDLDTKTLAELLTCEDGLYRVSPEGGILVHDVKQTFYDIGLDVFRHNVAVRLMARVRLVGKPPLGALAVLPRPDGHEVVLDWVTE